MTAQPHVKSRAPTASHKRALRRAAALLDENADIIWSSNITTDDKFAGSADELREYKEHRRLANRLRAIAEGGE